MVARYGKPYKNLIAIEKVVRGKEEIKENCGRVSGKNKGKIG